MISASCAFYCVEHRNTKMLTVHSICVERQRTRILRVARRSRKRAQSHVEEPRVPVGGPRRRRLFLLLLGRRRLSQRGFLETTHRHSRTISRSQIHDPKTQRRLQRNGRQVARKRTGRYRRRKKRRIFIIFEGRILCNIRRKWKWLCLRRP